MKLRYFLYVGIGLFAALLLFSLLSGFAAKYTPLCGACHAVRTQYLSAAASDHKQLGCLQCHREPGLGGLVLLPLQATTSFLSLFHGGKGTKADINNDVCLNCHPRVYSDTTAYKGIRVNHEALIDAGWRCTRCHGNTGHKSTAAAADNLNPGMDKCFQCHQGKRRLKCRACHLTKPKAKPVSLEKTGSLAHDNKWLSRHGLGDLKPCYNCHSKRDCRRCHDLQMPHPNNWPNEHGAKAVSLENVCSKCHQRHFCQNCHKTAMPHTRPYIHGNLGVKNYQKCSRCHYQTDCDNCHKFHFKHQQKRREKQ